MSITQILMAIGKNLPFSPTTVQYISAGTFTETVPAGATHVSIECWAGSGSGGGGASGGPHGGGGGGGAGYCRSNSLSCVGGQTLSIVVGAGGGPAAVDTNGNPGANTVISSGTMTITTMTAGRGLGGNKGTSTAGGAANSGNVASSGGNAVNSGAGAPGTFGFAASLGTGGTGGINDTAGAASFPVLNASKGGNASFGSQFAGADGLVRLYYS